MFCFCSLLGKEIQNLPNNRFNFLLQHTQAECDEYKHGFEGLESEVLTLCDKCSPSEAKDLSSKHETLKNAHQRLLKLVRCRIELCQEWTKFAAMAKKARAKLDTLQTKFATTEMTQAEVDASSQELAELRQELSGWDDKRRHLIQLMKDAEMTIKDRSTQRIIEFQVEITEILTYRDRSAVQLKEKQGQLDELSTLWSQFEEMRRKLAGTIETTERQVEGVKVKDSSLQGIKDMSVEMKAVEDDFESHNPELKEFRELGHQLMAADTGNQNVAREVLGKKIFVSN